MFHFRPLQLVIVFALIIASLSTMTPNPVFSTQDGTSLPVGNTGVPASFAQAGTTNTLMPSAMLAQGVTAIAAGGSHTCVLTSMGGVQVLGLQQFRSVRRWHTDTTSHPRPCQWPHEWRDGDCGRRVSHLCSDDTGGIKCWGGNSDGQLGDGTTTDRLTPVDVAGLTKWREGDYGRQVSHLRADERRRCQVLGQKQFRSVGRRYDDAAPNPSRCQWSHERRDGDCGWSVSYLCSEECRRRQVLGGQGLVT